MVIEDLFESLNHTAESPENAPAVYGKQVVANEEQVKVLVALSHIFPQRLTNAIAAIENGHCVQYKCRDRRIWVIELIPVCLSYWLCSCKDFEIQLREKPTGVSKWNCTCKHLLAAYILENRYPIVDHDLIREVSVSISQMTTISLEGTAYLDEEVRNATNPFD